jgi:lipopolysaccharide transport system permease protein
LASLSPSVSYVKAANAEARKLWHLLVELVRRDFKLRFAGSALGFAWAILQPLSLVLLFWFVFTQILVIRIPMAGTENYAIFLIAGFLPWVGLNEGITRGTTSIVDNAAMVRRLTLKSEILVVVPNVTAVLFELIGIGLFLAFLLLSDPRMTKLWVLPLVVTIQLLLQVGISLFLAATFVFLRDVIQVLGFVLSFVFYLSPILYPAVGRFERFFAWNPMTPLLGLFRSALIGSPLPGVGSIVFLLAVTSAVFAGGLWFFRRARPRVADFL